MARYWLMKNNVEVTNFRMDAARADIEDGAVRRTPEPMLHSSTVEALGRAFGGREMVFPVEQRGKAWDELVAGVGDDHARACVRWLGGCRVYIPKTHSRTEMHEAVRAMRASGMSANRIADEVYFLMRFTARQIYRICEKE